MRVVPIMNIRDLNEGPVLHKFENDFRQLAIMMRESLAITPGHADRVTTPQNPDGRFL